MDYDSPVTFDNPLVTYDGTITVGANATSTPAVSQTATGTPAVAQPASSTPTVSGG